MPDFTVRSDSVNVEQIMEQIRGRIREKRGVDYTEQQIRDLAAVKLEKFLDPRGVRSDLLEQFRKAQPSYTPPELPNYSFEAETMYASTRAPLRWIRKLLNPLLKLFFNPNPLIQAMNIQSRLNTMYAEREARREATRRAFDQLQYELMHNLVIETTRMSIDVKNLKMRVESLASRLEFNERRARALESVVVYKPSPQEAGDRPAVAAVDAGRDQRPRVEPAAARPQSAPHGSAPVYTDRNTPPRVEPPREAQARQSQERPAAMTGQGSSGPGQPAGEGPGQRSRRRRRRRGRRGGGSAAAIMGGAGPAAAPSSPESVSHSATADSTPGGGSFSQSTEGSAPAAPSRERSDDGPSEERPASSGPEPRQGSDEPQ